MTFNEIICGLNELIKDRESFIDKDDPDDMFTHDKAVLEEAVKLLHPTQRNGQIAVPQCRESLEMTATGIYKAALEKWGPEAQTLMVFEEMSELQKELCKAARGKQNKDAIAEEIADVYITLGQMVILHQCKKEVEDYKAQKLKRLAERIAEKCSTNDTKYKSLLKQARILSVERRPEACIGCGFEHNCSTHGCAVINHLIETARRTNYGWKDDEISQAQKPKKR